MYISAGIQNVLRMRKEHREEKSEKKRRRGKNEPLDEFVLRDQLLESILSDVVVVDAVLLAGARAARRVGDGERKGARVPLEE